MSGQRALWYDWASADEKLLEYVRRLIQIRQTEPVFRRRDFLVGEEAAGSPLPDVVWMRPDGQQIGDLGWSREDARALGVFLNGQGSPITIATAIR